MKYSDEQAMAYREAYESGKSLHDLAAEVAARGKASPSYVTIKDLIVRAGGTMRSQAEGALLAKRKKHYE